MMTDLLDLNRLRKAKRFRLLVWFVFSVTYFAAAAVVVYEAWRKW